MRNRSFATLGLLTLLAAASAFGQFGTPRLRADIPFEFHVGATIMPAGTYEVDMSFKGNSNLVSIECFECGTHALALTSNVGGGNTANTEGRLVFSKYGDTYFLSQVWASNRAEGSALAKSKSEREIARATPPAETNPVLLALR